MLDPLTIQRSALPSWAKASVALAIIIGGLLNAASALAQHVVSVPQDQPGQYEMRIPLDHVGHVELSADRWVAPATLGIGSSDQRQLSYRVVRIEEQPKNGG